MFCSNCGQFIEEGKAYCRHCGSPVPRSSQESADEKTIRPRAPGTASTSGAAAESAVVPPPSQPQTPSAAPVPEAPSPPPPRPWSPSPLPPPSVASLLSQPTPVAETPPPPPPPPVPAAPDWQPPTGPGDRRSRTGLLVGIVVAAVIVLAGAGVGVYFGFFHEGGGTDGSVTTIVGSSTTTERATTSTGGPATSGAVTTQTIPGLTTSTGGPGTTGTPTTAGPGTTEDLLAAYLAAAEDLTVALDRADRRIPELAAEINDTAPAVPTRVRDDLSAMLSGLDALNVELASLDVPPGFEDSYYWLEEATMRMGNRIDATIQGIEAIWAAGKVNAAATAFFDTGRAERDAYRAAMKKYYEFLPAD